MIDTAEFTTIEAFPDNPIDPFMQQTFQTDFESRNQTEVVLAYSISEQHEFEQMQVLLPSFIKAQRETQEKNAKAAQKLSMKLGKAGRCPICTLAPPCMHMGSEGQVIDQINTLQTILPFSEYQKSFPFARHAIYKMTSPIARYLQKVESYGLDHNEFLQQTERQMLWH